MLNNPVFFQVFSPPFYSQLPTEFILFKELQDCSCQRKFFKLALVEAQDESWARESFRALSLDKHPGFHPVTGTKRIGLGCRNESVGRNHEVPCMLPSVLLGFCFGLFASGAGFCSKPRSWSVVAVVVLGTENQNKNLFREGFLFGSVPKTALFIPNPKHGVSFAKLFRQFFELPFLRPPMDLQFRICGFAFGTSVVAAKMHANQDLFLVSVTDLAHISHKRTLGLLPSKIQ